MLGYQPMTHRILGTVLFHDTDHSFHAQLCCSFSIISTLSLDGYCHYTNRAEIVKCLVTDDHMDKQKALKHCCFKASFNVWVRGFEFNRFVPLRVFLCFPVWKKRGKSTVSGNHIPLRVIACYRVKGK